MHSVRNHLPKFRIPCMLVIFFFFSNYIGFSFPACPGVRFHVSWIYITRYCYLVYHQKSVGSELGGPLSKHT